MLTDGRMLKRGDGVGLYSLVRSVVVSEEEVRKKIDLRSRDGDDGAEKGGVAIHS